MLKIHLIVILTPISQFIKSIWTSTFYIDYVFRFKVWHYTSTLFHEKMLEQKVESTKPQNENVAPALPELWEVAFQPALKGTYPENFPILDKPVGGGLKLKEPQASKQAYRPPMAR